MSSTPQKIGHGAVGCVYRPAIPCKDGTVPEGYVSKLVKKTSLPMEYNEEILAKLKEIDPDEQYVIRPVKPEEICATNAEASAETIASCAPLKEGFATPLEKNTAVLYQKNAGPTTLADLIANEYTVPYNPSSVVIQALQATVEAENFLLSHGLAYVDAQYTNIMVLSDGSIRFIDTAGITKIKAGKESEFREAFKYSLQTSKVKYNRQVTVPFLSGFPKETGLQLNLVGSLKEVQNKQGFKNVQERQAFYEATLSPENAAYFNNFETETRRSIGVEGPPTLSLSFGTGNENNENNENENSVPTLVLPNEGGKRRGKRRSRRGLKKRKRSTKKVRRSR
jgi:hypothetical protein